MRSLAIEFLCRLQLLANHRQAASAIEYALMAGLIAVVIVSAVSAVGANLGASFYGKIAAAMT